MDIYQIATAFWDQRYDNSGYTKNKRSVSATPGPDETPPLKPRPEIPVPTIPEETPPLERPSEPNRDVPELPPVAPVVPEVDPIPVPETNPLTQF